MYCHLYTKGVMFRKLMNIRAFSIFALITAVVWIGWLGFSGRLTPLQPEPDVVIVIINDDVEVEYHTFRETLKIDVPVNKSVSIKVLLFYHGMELGAGEFSYQWCFDPENNLNEHCEKEHYKGNVFTDYLPTRIGEVQSLTINVIDNDFYEPVSVHVQLAPQ